MTEPIFRQAGEGDHAWGMRACVTVKLPADALSCPLCEHAGAVRDFLSMRRPTRPNRVEVHLIPAGSPARIIAA